MTRSALLFLLLLFLTGCASPPKSDLPQLGEPVAVPMGYVFHCIDYPDSIFCTNADDD